MKNNTLLKIAAFSICGICSLVMIKQEPSGNFDPLYVQAADTTKNLDGNIVEVGTKTDNGTVTNEDYFPDDWLETEPAGEEATSHNSNSDDTQSGKKKTGWYTVKGEKYYYINNVKAKGWKKIAAKQYYFKETALNKGSLQKNKIVGNKKGGYYYVDAKGVRVNKKTINKVVSIVRKNTKSSSENEKKLSKIYKYYVKKYKYKDGEDKFTSGNIDKTTQSLIKNKKGTSLAFASVMAYSAKTLGYNSRVVTGTITYNGTAKAKQFWCEVKISGKW
ncbi:MAG: hypothetical protein IKN54_05615 [Lachnospiraceae bacterium]|nr:hypothetical protein [Lachnospiraceae bacterium]